VALPVKSTEELAEEEEQGELDSEEQKDPERVGEPLKVALTEGDKLPVALPEEVALRVRVKLLLPEPELVAEPVRTLAEGEREEVAQLEGDRLRVRLPEEEAVALREALQEKGRSRRKMKRVRWDTGEAISEICGGGHTEGAI